MTLYDRAPAQRWTTSPRRRFAILLASALALALLPVDWSRPLRRLVDDALRPGQVATTRAAETIDGGLARLRGLLSSSQRYAELERQLDELRTRNAQLQATALMLAEQDSNELNSLPPVKPTASLVTARLMQARVIGQHLQSLVRDEATLDLGTAAGLRDGAWAIDANGCLIDQGAQSLLRRGELVLAGRRVLGKISQAGTYTSHVQRPTGAGYRDLVQLAYRQDKRLTLGPRGVLEGTGEPLCRVRMVPVTESVSVGDILLTAGSEGIASSGLLYGEVVRVERPAGASHWEIWMRPAANGRWPDEVAVVTAVVNEQRVSPLAASEAAAMKGQR
ncbi:MAG: hypothetical protein HUU23_07620 [Caldilineales bacterium]|jgi:cell shape-determining protein MreC|nr:hypothetical protein [Caldilineales bacterium]